MHLLPQPKRLRLHSSLYRLPAKAVLTICDRSLASAAQAAHALLRTHNCRSETALSAQGVTADIALKVDSGLRTEEYHLRILAKGILLTGGTPVAVRYGLATLSQVLQQNGREALPCLTIRDWPDFAERGLYYDVCRGRVPHLAGLKTLADQLAHYKINQLQLYIEHTFAFKTHPEIGRSASPLTTDDILELDAFCAERGIELIPSLASFGHMSNILTLPAYRHLAEDYGSGIYDARASESLAPRYRGWTLAPANPDTYTFLDSLFAGFLPLFRSSRFNICCDETYDLGLGQSYELCRRQGRGKVYLEHIRKVRALSRKYGKTVMFWGDIIRKYPELIPRIPKDIRVLDWGYTHDHPFERIADFKQAGVRFYACPGTSSWVSLFPRTAVACKNISAFAAAAKRHGAQGILTTDWGDGGHFNFMEYSWHGYLFGAEQSWNTRAETDSYNRRFNALFLGFQDRAFEQAFTSLGDISTLSLPPYYQSIWKHVFFGTPSDALFHWQGPQAAVLARRGKVQQARLQFNAVYGTKCRERLKSVRREFLRVSRLPGTDPEGILPYWIFAVDTLLHATRKLSILGPGGNNTPRNRRSLQREMTNLLERFDTLWHARNRHSEFRITRAAYQRAIRSLNGSGRSRATKPN